MDKYIAIRKQSRLKDVPELQSAPIERKLEALVARAQNSDRADKLESSGFRQIPPPNENGAEFEPLPHDTAAFTRLGFVGAYIVSVPDQTSHQQAKSLLGEDYWLIPDAPLSLPPRVYPEPLRKPNPDQTSRSLIPRGVSGVADAWHAGVKGKGVIVGVLDSGCDADHDEFKHYSDGIEFVTIDGSSHELLRRNTRASDREGHGTHVCGIIAGHKVGIAPEVELRVAAALGGDNAGRTTIERVTVGLEWLLSTYGNSANRNKPMIVNLSFGFLAEQIERLGADNISRFKQLFENLLHDYEVLSVAAIGNAPTHLDRNDIRAPGYLSDVLSVGAVDFDLNHAYFSAYGKSPDSEVLQPDLVGFGSNIYSSSMRDKQGRSVYADNSGTSMAASYVTGIAALYASANSALRGIRLRDKLLETALELSAEREKVGRGLARYVTSKV